MDNKILKQKAAKYAVVTFLLFFIPIALYLIPKGGDFFWDASISLSFGLPLPFAIGVYCQGYYMRPYSELKSVFLSLLITVVSFWVLLPFLLVAGEIGYGAILFVLFGTLGYILLGYFLLKKTQSTFYKENYEDLNGSQKNIVDVKNKHSNVYIIIALILSATTILYFLSSRFL